MPTIEERRARKSKRREALGKEPRRKTVGEADREMRTFRQEAIREDESMYVGNRVVTNPNQIMLKQTTARKRSR